MTEDYDGKDDSQNYGAKCNAHSNSVIAEVADNIVVALERAYNLGERHHDHTHEENDREYLRWLQQALCDVGEVVRKGDTCNNGDAQ